MLHDPLATRLSEVTWQIESLISPLPKDLWSLKFAWYSLITSETPHNVTWFSQQVVTWGHVTVNTKSILLHYACNHQTWQDVTYNEWKSSIMFLWPSGHIGVTWCTTWWCADNVVMWGHVLINSATYALWQDLSPWKFTSWWLMVR